MRLSHYIFLGFVAIYMAIFAYEMNHPDMQPFIDDFGYFFLVLKGLENLMVACAVYTAFLLVRRYVEKRRNKSELTSKKTSV